MRAERERARTECQPGESRTKGTDKRPEKSLVKSLVKSPMKGSKWIAS
jgi:hypothetical protein